MFAILYRKKHPTLYKVCIFTLNIFLTRVYVIVSVKRQGTQRKRWRSFPILLPPETKLGPGLLRSSPLLICEAHRYRGLRSPSVFVNDGYTLLAVL